MLNQRKANPMTPNPGLWLVERNYDSYEYWWEPISYASLIKSPDVASCFDRPSPGGNSCESVFLYG